jgi:hypothetical protein
LISHYSVHVEVSVNSRIDQAMDMGVGAGVMYFFDPDLGQRRREQLLDETKEQLVQIGQAAAQASQRAGEVARQMSRQARDAAFDAAGQTRAAALSTAKSVLDLAVQTSSMAGARTKSVGQRAGAQAVQSAARAGQTVRANLGEAVPAAKAVLLEKLVVDERAMEKARASLAGSKFFAPPARRSFAPWSILLLLGGGLVAGASLMFILDPGQGRPRRASVAGFVRERFGYARRQTADTLARAGAQVRERAGGLGVRQEPAAELPGDVILAERVRARLADVSSHPDSIIVTTQDGEVVLSGVILGSEVDRVVGAVSALPGVQSVANRLEVRSTVERIPGAGRKNNH